MTLTQVCNHTNVIRILEIEHSNEDVTMSTGHWKILSSRILKEETSGEKNTPQTWPLILTYYYCTSVVQIPKTFEIKRYHTHWVLQLWCFIWSSVNFIFLHRVKITKSSLPSTTYTYNLHIWPEYKFSFFSLKETHFKVLNRHQGKSPKKYNLLLNQAIKPQ